MKFGSCMDFCLFFKAEVEATIDKQNTDQNRGDSTECNMKCGVMSLAAYVLCV